MTGGKGQTISRRIGAPRGSALFLVAALQCLAMMARCAEGVEFEGKAGPGRDKHVVLLAGDEEYRSEEGLPMLAKILAVRHGFDCTVLFSINAATGDIDPECQTNLPGLEALERADLCVMQLRFRELPDGQMRHFVDYVNSGRPLIALRTSTHAFAYQRNKSSPYARYDWSSGQWPGGFGEQVLGETWISHHGTHGVESTRGVINPALEGHPILRGVADLWWPSDVYTVKQRPAEEPVLVWGQVLSGMKPDDPPVAGAKNNPLMPVAWVRDYTGEGGKAAKVVTITAGAAVDLQNEGLRRLLVNAVYWTLGLEDKLAPKADVSLVGAYHPSSFGFGGYKKGIKPSDLKMEPAPKP
jgi:hypothetical protein